MKCHKCGIDYPKKIYEIHIKACENEEPIIESPVETIQALSEDLVTIYQDMSYNELRNAYKERGLTGLKANPKMADLLKALTEV